MVKYNKIFEKEKLDKSNFEDVVIANGELQEKVIFLRDLIKTLKNRLSYTTEPKT